MAKKGKNKVTSPKIAKLAAKQMKTARSKKVREVGASAVSQSGGKSKKKSK